MEAEHAVLSSASTTLADLTDRIESLAETLRARREEAIASDLFEVERTLRVATRRLESVLRRMG
jgi:hypothetical protein